jgi:hypothetical protein
MMKRRIYRSPEPGQSPVPQEQWIEAASEAGGG